MEALARTVKHFASCNSGDGWSWSRPSAAPGRRSTRPPRDRFHGLRCAPATIWNASVKNGAFPVLSSTQDETRNAFSRSSAARIRFRSTSSNGKEKCEKQVEKTPNSLSAYLSPDIQQLISSRNKSCKKRLDLACHKSAADRSPSASALRPSPINRPFRKEALLLNSTR